MRRGAWSRDSITYSVFPVPNYIATSTQLEKMFSHIFIELTKPTVVRLGKAIRASEKCSPLPFSSRPEELTSICKIRSEGENGCKKYWIVGCWGFLIELYYLLFDSSSESSFVCREMEFARTKISSHSNVT